MPGSIVQTGKKNPPPPQKTYKCTGSGPNPKHGTTDTDPDFTISAPVTPDLPGKSPEPDMVPLRQ